MRTTLAITLLTLCALFTGCTVTQPAYNAAQHTGALGEGTVGVLVLNWQRISF